MAKTVTEFPKVRRGRPEIYPYKEWLNGKKWALVQGEDFHVSPASFKAALYAKKNTMTNEAGETFVIKTSTKTVDGVTTVYVQRLFGAAAKARAERNKGLGRKPKAKAKA